MSNRPLSFLASNNKIDINQVSPTTPLPVTLVAGDSSATLTALVAPTAGLTTLNANLNSGVATAASSIEFALRGASTLNFQVQGTWTGTLLLQGTVDGVNWKTIAGLMDVSQQLPVNSIVSAATGIWQADVSGFSKVRVTCSAAMTGTAQVSGILTAADSMLALDAPANLAPSANFGASSTVKLIAAATTNATVVKASAGTINAGSICNPSAAVKFFKLYNKATAPTVGTDIPVMTLLLPIGGVVPLPTGAFGLRLPTGISFALTALAADADATAVAAGDVIVNLNYT